MFFATHHTRLFAAMTAVSGNRQEAEEIMQEAFLKLWERWDRVSRLDDPEGYVRPRLGLSALLPRLGGCGGAGVDPTSPRASSPGRTAGAPIVMMTG